MTSLCELPLQIGENTLEQLCCDYRAYVISVQLMQNGGGAQ